MRSGYSSRSAQRPGVMNGRSWPFAACLVGTAVLGTATATTGDQLSPGKGRTVSPLVNDYVRAMGGTNWTQREDAAAALVATPDLGLAEVEGLLRGSGLSEEQRLRLERIGQACVAREPRGALGVRFGNLGARDGAVEVGATYEGFDAHRLLRQGDLLYAIDDVRLDGSDSARVAILSHNPGERVAIKLFRKGEPLLVRATLGNFDTLNQAGPEQGRGGDVRTDLSLMSRCWRARYAREVEPFIDHKAPIDPGFTMRRVIDLNTRATKAQTERDASGHTPGADDGQDGEENTPSVSAGTQNPTLLELPGAFQEAAAQRTANPRVQQIRNQISTITQQIAGLRRAQRDLNWGAAERLEINRKLQILNAQLAQLNSELKIATQNGGRVRQPRP